MGAWAYCTNEDCQRGFDKPSFAEITARKRECPACGHTNHVGDDLGTALDEKFAEIAELLTAGSQPVAVPDVAAGTIVPPQVPQVAGKEANTAPPPFLCTLTVAPYGVIANVKDAALLPAGIYNVVLNWKES